MNTKIKAPYKKRGVYILLLHSGHADAGQLPSSIAPMENTFYSSHKNIKYVFKAAEENHYFCYYTRFN